MKILYVANVHRHFNAFHLPYLKWLKDQGCIVHVAANGDEIVPYVDKQFNIKVQRSPYKLQNIVAYKELKSIIDNQKYDLIHCHTPMGGILARLASRKTRKRGSKVIYTAHGFHFCHGGPIINWLLYYPIERFMARYTDALITINTEDYQTAKSFKVKEHYSIPGIGLDLKKMRMKTQLNKIEKREELNIPMDDLVLTSVGDLTKRKNHEVVIRAIAKLGNIKLRYVICGTGEQESYLRDLASKLKVEDKVIFMGYRTDVNEILKASDIFVFPSLWEGLGIAGIEAMASGIPVIASNRHGILDYAIDNRTALLCEPKDEESFANGIYRLISEKGLAEKLVTNAYEIINQFDIHNSLQRMKEIYIKYI
ncbi:hypothetical protein BME96_16100 [Virgibacillus halodenitrificans]|uniref:Glycosyltransferase n=1 Tax=Virgibacillus halodenitrificans TaxID=1482 RepID=A0AAC9J2A9_VIRHA|nr:glycosyltransferase family 4 protein [Virgibacillus halodenitrificans]APC49620.1 hypothetical protein BME96_16100 [Virgibacillus halodenitrificans]